MKTIRTTYVRIIERFGAYLDEVAVELEADCEQFDDEVIVVWTDACLATLAAADLDGDELVGCEEAMESAFFAAEQEQCRLANVRQRTGERAA